MSSDIWTRCAGASEVRPLRLAPWRVVEAQHLISTRKLVDSDAEQLVLEQLIERAKPPTSNRRLHYLLTTPFRYPPLPYGSRFGTAIEPGLWYGSESVATALSESAYYRVLFIEASRADLGTLRAEVTAFQVRLRTEHGVDLREAPFRTHRAVISSPIQYTQSQALGAAMRAEGVEAFVYRSARDPAGEATSRPSWLPSSRGRNPTRFRRGIPSRIGTGSSSGSGTTSNGWCYVSGAIRFSWMEYSRHPRRDRGPGDPHP